MLFNFDALSKIIFRCCLKSWSWLQITKIVDDYFRRLFPFVLSVNFNCLKWLLLVVVAFQITIPYFVVVVVGVWFSYCFHNFVHTRYKCLNLPRKRAVFKVRFFCFTCSYIIPSGNNVTTCVLSSKI